MTSRQPSRRSGTGAISNDAEVDQQRAVVLAVQRGELVEQAGVRARPTRSPTREHKPRQRRADPSPARPRRASRARRQATSSAAEEDRPEPRGTVPLISQARADEREAGALQLGDDAAHERAPAARGGGGSDSAKLVVLAEIERRARRSRAAAAPRAHGHALADRERQREAVVVVGVLADQVDASGGERAPRSRGTGDRLAQGARRSPPAWRRR